MPEAHATVRVNGAARAVDRATTLAELVAEFAGRPVHDGLAVAVNGDVVPRRRWHERRVDDGDDIEIVRAVQGG